MSYDFSADDIFEMAEQMERNGAKFYRTAAENAADTSAKEFLINDLLIKYDVQYCLMIQLCINDKHETIFNFILTYNLFIQ